MLNRRALLGGLAASGTITPSLGLSAQFVNEWTSFKSDFLSKDGRIIDNGNGGVSHSEGQGWGVCFSPPPRTIR
jgi:endo-1,4-beta-D-glucanase Y